MNYMLRISNPLSRIIWGLGDSHFSRNMSPAQAGFLVLGGCLFSTNMTPAQAGFYSPSAIIRLIRFIRVLSKITALLDYWITALNLYNSQLKLLNIRIVICCFDAPRDIFSGFCRIDHLINP
mgnify:CR=1 FL=1